MGLCFCCCYCRQLCACPATKHTTPQQLELKINRFNRAMYRIYINSSGNQGSGPTILPLSLSSISVLCVWTNSSPPTASPDASLLTGGPRKKAEILVWKVGTILSWIEHVSSNRGEGCGFASILCGSWSNMKTKNCKLVQICFKHFNKITMTKQFPCFSHVKFQFFLSRSGSTALIILFGVPRNWICVRTKWTQLSLYYALALGDHFNTLQI